MSIKISQLQSFSLAGSGVSISDTTMTLSSFQTIDGVDLAMTDFGAKGYMTIEPGSRDREEQISFTGVTQNASGTCTLTGIKTVLFLSPYTETAGFSKSHPGGVVAVVTNTSGFYNEFGVKQNNETLTGYWEASDPLTTQGLATKNYVDNLVSGGNVSVSALIQIGIAGETVAAGNPVYLKASDGRWWKATGATAATVNVIQLGIAQGAGTAGNNITGGVLRRGTDTNQSGGVVGSIGYISDTNTISTSAGTTERAVGNFLTATTFNFDPDFYYIPTANQKAAFVGTSGTPSTSNKFVTNNDTFGSGSLVRSTVIFGGTGADGALSISSGTTTIDLGNATSVTKNYTSISITGTANLAFSNPNSTYGTVVTLKSQGNVTVTTSTVPAISVKGLGGIAAFQGSSTIISAPGAGANGGTAVSPFTNTGGSGGNKLGSSFVLGKSLPIVCGSGGGSGATGNSSASEGGGGGGGGGGIIVSGDGASNATGTNITNGAGGTGGRGGGALYIECAGAFETSSTFNASGNDGSNATGTGANGGGGGGGGGMIVIIYNSLTSNTGTYTVAGGAAGTKTGNGSNGGAGGAGTSLVALNTQFT